MNQDNSMILSRVFTRNTLRELIDNSSSETYSAAINKYLSNSANKTNVELIRDIYTVLSKDYRNEYFYKNTLLNKLLLGIHSTNTTTALTEVAVARSKADFVLINGKAVVYEVKTELDNFDRLAAQLSDYYKAFSYVSVITCEDNLELLTKILADTPTGICILTKRNVISQRKKPVECTDYLDLNIIFKVMVKQEYESIIIKHYGKLPDTNQFDYYRTCKKLFCSFNVAEVHKEFVAVLKKRYKVSSEQYEKVPYELKFLVYFSKLHDNDYSRLYHFLQSQEDKICTSLT